MVEQRPDTNRVNPYFADWRLPGVDFDAIALSQRRTIEAVASAQRVAFDATQTVLRRNADLFRDSIIDFSGMLSDAAKFDASNVRLAGPAELSRKAIEKGLTNFTDLTSLIVKGQAEVMEILSKRLSDGAEEACEFTLFQSKSIA